MAYLCKNTEEEFKYAVILYTGHLDLTCTKIQKTSNLLQGELLWKEPGFFPTIFP